MTLAGVDAGNYTLTQPTLTGNITKLAGPAAPEGISKTDVTAFGLNDGTLVGTASGQEYQKDAGVWVEISGTPVTDLAPGSYVVRVAETPTHLAGTATDAFVIAEGAPSVMGGSVSITGVTKYDQTLTAVPSLTYTPTTDLDEPTYQWKRGEDDIVGATNSTYTLVEADIGSTITVVVTADAAHATGSVTSSATDVVTKADGPAAPSAPENVSHTSTTITMVANALHEFTKGGGIWQDSEIFTGLSPSTEYNIRARVKATATTFESATSDGTLVTTDAP
jgi:hypothetical protein